TPRRLRHYQPDVLVGIAPTGARLCRAPVLLAHSIGSLSVGCECVYLMISTSESTTSPSSTISSHTGSTRLIFSSVSTTEIIIGRSLERPSQPDLCTRCCAP